VPGANSSAESCPASVRMTDVPSDTRANILAEIAMRSERSECRREVAIVSQPNCSQLRLAGLQSLCRMATRRHLPLEDSSFQDIADALRKFESFIGS
jgi:hypothetical protein